MGYYSRYTGRIDIDPPLPWALIKDSPSYPGAGFDSDVRLAIREDVTETEDGVITKRYAVAIVPATDEPYQGGSMTEDIQAVVDLAGPRTFRGYIEAQGADGELWRIRVANGRATELRPLIVWPEDGE